MNIYKLSFLVVLGACNTVQPPIANRAKEATFTVKDKSISSIWYNGYSFILYDECNPDPKGPPCFPRYFELRFSGNERLRLSDSDEYLSDEHIIYKQLKDYINNNDINNKDLVPRNSRNNLDILQAAMNSILVIAREEVSIDVNTKNAEDIVSFFPLLAECIRKQGNDITSQFQQFNVSAINHKLDTDPNLLLFSNGCRLRTLELNFRSNLSNIEIYPQGINHCPSNMETVKFTFRNENECLKAFESISSRVAQNSVPGYKGEGVVQCTDINGNFDLQYFSYSRKFGCFENERWIAPPFENKINTVDRCLYIFNHLGHTVVGTKTETNWQPQNGFILANFMGVFRGTEIPCFKNVRDGSRGIFDASSSVSPDCKTYDNLDQCKADHKFILPSDLPYSWGCIHLETGILIYRLEEL